ncbi:MAG: beta-ketoacyl synthase N-terminal-like domain-containing protein [Deltaproteobacteria bacterium]
MSCEYVITGIGIVSPIGIGNPVFWDALLAGRTGIKEIKSFNTEGQRSRLGAEINTDDIDAVFSDKRFRRAAKISKYCLAAADMAIKDSGLNPSVWDPAKTGLVVGVTHGAMNYTRDFHTALIREGALSASPMFFSDSVLNAPAGNASIAFNIKGAAHTIAGGIPAGIDAIDYAIRVMRNNNLDVCIAGGAEEIDALVFDSYARFGLLSPNNRGKEGIKPFASDRNGFVTGEGACMLVLEKKEAAVKRGAVVYAGISDANPLGTDFKSVPSDDRGKIIYAVTGANGAGKDVIEARILKALLAGNNKNAARVFVGNIKPLTGECFAAGSAMQAASAAMALHKGIIPPSTIGEGLIKEMDWCRPNTKEEEVKADMALISSIGFEGSGSLLVLKSHGF